jgi:5,5'-dehydrodivanillate O-demethylase oxygenase subunit
MLDEQTNDMLCRVGRGTPAGELLRRYWMPIAPRAEIDEVIKRPVKLLGEDLIVYKDGLGRYGLLAEHCSHRAASLWYGKIDGEGIRCPYHGWKYDLTGRCLDQPAEPKDSTYKDSIHHTAYPVQEMGGMLFGYLGPVPAPLVPRFDILAREDWVRRIEIHPVLDCNWVQPMENAVDPAHLYWLHGYTGGAPRQTPDDRNDYEEFAFGIYKSHISEKRIETHPLVFPNILRGPGNVAHYRIPMDDTHTRIMYIIYSPAPNGRQVEQETVPYKYIGPIKEEYDDYGYARFRHHMQTFASQDGMAWETQGTLTDRTQERLGVSDKGIIMFRQMLQKQIEAVAQGRDPLGVIRDPGENDIINFTVEEIDRVTGAEIPYGGYDERSFATPVRARTWGGSG